MIVLKGLEGPVTVKGVQFGTAVMQPWDKTLTDAKIADVLTYIRQEWGNAAPPVAKEGVAALRKGTRRACRVFQGARSKSGAR